MSWLRISYRCGRDLGDRIGERLEACGAIAVSVTNAGAEESFDAGYPGDPEWSEVYVSALFAPGTDPGTVAASVIGNSGGDKCIQPLRIDELAEQDWVRAWSQDCRPTRITDRLWICPSSVEPPVADAANIIIDPGLAFGTGTHPTTRLCLQWLATADVDGKSVVDYGCGTGILAIAALMLGADHAWAIDIDRHALAAARYNARRNHVADKLTVLQSADIGLEPVDVVIANILANVVVGLAPNLTALVQPGGTILLTGILDSQVERVRAAFSEKFEFVPHRRQDWTLLVGRSVSC